MNAGLGPDWIDDSSTHAEIRLYPGHESVASTTIRVEHNTVYGGGFAAAAETSSGMLLVEPEGIARSTLLIRNNLLRSTGAPYLAAWSGSMPSSAGFNLWFGAGAAPSWDTAAVHADPQLDGQYRPPASSPAVDAGTPTTLTSDLDGQPRSMGTAPDIGCYERVP